MSSCKIYLSGAHSTGKTTLLNDLKPHLNVQCAEEIARSVIEQNHWQRKDFLPSKRPDNFLRLNEEIIKQQIQIDERNHDSNTDFIADRCIDPLIYVQLYIGSEAKENLYEIPGLLNWVERLKSALIFVIKPNIRCIYDDGVRIPPTIEDLENFHTLLLHEYNKLGIHVTEITEIERQDRKNIVLDKIKCSYPWVLK